MKTRKDFPKFIASLGLLGQGAEIGVYKAGFSSHILSNWTGESLYLIDPWKFQGRAMDKSDVSDNEHAGIFLEAKTAVSKFGHRAKICRKTSHEAASEFSPEELDFVYIDGCHDYRSVWSDLADWYPIVKNGGVIAGHDYKNSCVRKNLVEVKRAVDNFFLAIGKPVLTTTDDNLPTWYVIK